MKSVDVIEMLSQTNANKSFSGQHLIRSIPDSDAEFNMVAEWPLAV